MARSRASQIDCNTYRVEKCRASPGKTRLYVHSEKSCRNERECDGHEARAQYVLEHCEIELNFSLGPALAPRNRDDEASKTGKGYCYFRHGEEKLGLHLNSCPPSNGSAFGDQQQR